MSDNSFFRELRKRKVIQAAVIYSAVAWGVAEVVVTVVEQLFLPQWVSTLSVIGFVVGFPVAMFLAWTFDITSEGIQRTTVASRRGKASIAVSMLLLIAGTTGLFFLIKPALEEREIINSTVNSSTILPNSIAVLPFENLSANDDNAYFASGMHEDILTHLSKMGGMKVI